MGGTGNVKILFVAGFGPIVRDTRESRKLYGEAFGIPFKEESDSYLHTETLQGAKTFALRPLSQAAQSCFGKDSWPDTIPAPQAWLEFDLRTRCKVLTWQEVAQVLPLRLRNFLDLKYGIVAARGASSRNRRDCALSNNI